MIRLSKLGRCKKGAVYLEFLLVIWPLLLLMFGLTQIGLMYSAHLLVCQAAAKAVRAAIVILPDTADDYAGDEVNSIGDGSGLEAYSNAASGGRLDQIRMAARIVLGPAAPSIESYVGKSLSDGLGQNPFVSMIAGIVVWNKKATAVTFPDRSNEQRGIDETREQNGEEVVPTYLIDFSPRGNVTARVTFLYKCPVPIVRSIMCKSYSDLSKQSQAELDTVGAQSLGNIITELMSWRFIAITAERTLPNQGRIAAQ